MTSFRTLVGITLLVCVTIVAAACQTDPQEDHQMTLDEARSAMLLHVDAVVDKVGSDWSDRYEPSTFACSLPEGDGQQWTVSREGTIAETAASAAARVEEYFLSEGFEVRIRENSPEQIDVLVRGEDGLDIQFGAVDFGFAHIDGQSVCIASDSAIAGGVDSPTN